MTQVQRRFLRTFAGQALGLFVVAAILTLPGCEAATAEDPNDPERRLQVMWLGDSGSHNPAARARQLVPAMLDRNIEVYYTEDIDELTYPTMAEYDALLIYANIDEIAPEHEAALLDYVESGGGLVAVHSASFCFRNSESYIEMVGAQFREHGAEVFQTHVPDDIHPAFEGYEGFESWDETYVHHMHNEDRTVVEYRDDEPYSWVRDQGEGRVFYTAWGHDGRTFGNEGFHDLIERGIRYAAGQEVTAVLAERELHQPFEYEEASVPYYPPGQGRAGDADFGEMQEPLPAEESMQRYVLPAGFELQLFAAEPDIRKPVAMAWDERGRLWVAETEDYPNELSTGRDRISILEDTTGDGRADKFTVFADGLSIPTSLTFANGGVIVHQAPDTLFLKDTTGDDKADVREALFTGWATWDTHAGPSNALYGLDNWIWSTVGYAGFDGEVGGEEHEFGMGVLRFTPDGSAMEFLRRTNNNTWGLGISEEGLIFPSTANNNPSDFMPIPRRYYDGVHGVDASTLGGIADRARFLHMTDRIRQVDVHGGYTSAAGHALYTARTWPQHYWNRIAFVTDPTGNLVGQFVIDADGADFASRNPSNLLASDDEWASPIMAEVGPDGQVWVIDWYTFIVQHNPTPAGYETGPGNAYEIDLRETRHGRIYRVVYTGEDGQGDDQPLSLADADADQLVETLSHHNLLWRRHAQRLLVERGDDDVVPALIDLVQDDGVDAIGLNVGAIHALWTLHGLSAMADATGEAVATAIGALGHASPGVRRNALQVLPSDATVTDAILAADVFSDEDAQVRLAALLALARQPHSDTAGQAIFAAIEADADRNDADLDDAATFAAARHIGGFLAAAHAQRHGEHTDHDHDHDDDPQEAPNLLPNHGFAEAEDGEPVGWTVRHYSGEAEQALVDAGHERGGSLRISSESGADSSWYAYARVEPRTTYRLSAWIRTENLETSGNAHGALLNVHELQQTSGNRTRPLTGDNDWTYVETTFNSENRDAITINALFGGWGHATGTAWFDEITLVQTDAPTGDRLAGIIERVEHHARAEAGTAEVAAEVADDGTLVIQLGVIPDVLRFDQEELEVEAGQQVRIVFTNNDHMPHNVLILEPGTLDTVGQLADAMIAEADALERGYVPDTDAVLHATPMLDPQEQYTLEFTAPDEPGDYPYVCTFPGHWRIMNGTLIVN